MSEELTNPSFDINAKYKNMIETSEMIVDCYQSVIDKGYEPSIYVSLAYDVKNYLPNLLNENRELKKQLEEKNNGFVASTEELVEYAEENQKLKKQLTKKDELIKDLSFAVDDLEKHYKTQQKEFIEWLENEINKCEYGEKKYADSDDMSYHNENELRKEILAKYKEIIGSKDE